MSVSTSQLRRRTDRLTIADRRRFRRRLAGAARVAHRDRREEILAAIEHDLGRAEQRVEQRRASVPETIGYPGELPIAEHLGELKSAIADHQVVIVAGETGSGKSTQLPKLCIELGRGVEGRIGHTQPRRIAARAIAGRVAEELGSAVGGLVGFKVRFGDQVGDTTLVKVMTDGILLSEIHGDRLLLAYDTIIVDEAHERSLNVDFLLGYLKRLLPKRPDLKVIITSATIDTERFSKHFDGAPVLEVSGRAHPVEVRYRPLDDPPNAEPRDQADAICEAVREVMSEGPGDILVFCSGEREIRDASEALRASRLPDVEVVPLYARLSTAEQQRIFRPHQGRRIVVATNVAETSLTVPGIRAVVDTGVARISRYSRRTKVQRLPIEPVSQASANQRAGRCGRLGPGLCIRLYSEEDFNGRPEFTDPEIKRTNLASVILQMAAIGLGDIGMFPFLEPPDSRAIRDGIALLEELGAARADRRNTSRWLTDLGRTLARIPLDPRLARMVVEAHRRGCLREVLVISSALSIQDPRERPSGLEAKADALHARFEDEDSDLITWLNLWSYLRSEKRARSSSQFRRLCREEFLSYRRVREWQDVHGQLREVVGELEMTINRNLGDPEQVHRSLLAGLLSHVGRREPEGYEYQGARGIRFSIAPGSVLFKAAPEWVMAADLVETTRTWARGVAPVSPDVIEAMADHQVSRSHSDPWWDSEAGAAVATETVSLFGLTLVSDRTVQFARIDPASARELFIRHALVFGEWETHHAFDQRNREAIQQVVDIETRERRADLLVDDRAIEAFFDARIPGDITTVRHFDNWWKTAKDEAPHLLDLTVDDLSHPDSRSPDEGAFPDVWHHGDIELPISYEFDPSSPVDGLTIHVPLASLDRLDPDRFEWQVPGLRVELIDALIRTLPKNIRKPFVPIPETARSVAASIRPEDGPLIPALRRELSRRTGNPVPLDAFDLDAIPAHLLPHYRLVEDDGTVVAEGADLRNLRAGVADTVMERVQAASHEVEVMGLTAWTIGVLPAEVEIDGEGGSVMAFPALTDDGDSVSVRLYGTRHDQADSMWAGTRRLVLLSLPSPTRLARSLVDDDDLALALAGGPYESVREFTDDCLHAAVDRVMEEHGGPAWDGVRFDQLATAIRDDLHGALEDVIHTAGSVLSALQAVYLRMEGLGSVKFEETIEDVDIQLSRMIFPGFIGVFGAGRLRDIGRYVRAIDRRLERLPDNLTRDVGLMQRIQTLEAEHDGLLDSLPPSEKLADIGWMLQELRVATFAQTVGTSGPVSEKRVRAALNEVAITG